MYKVLMTDISWILNKGTNWVKFILSLSIKGNGACANRFCNNFITQTH
ncbi:hypothetical protein PPEP_a2780 [Pseudoalteromonas peptidolytica F12-50-A1]|uniref:Uncharacterized protein n=1 Tax=Pseudoalteromonas peptidolytica F12-50-A1 TaxID=1315280 RepID=A0A8I0T3T3_9GAMM|nr:hypothetical protein [Pseudoalteromonas peptidolytica F12-50-A1]